MSSGGALSGLSTLGGCGSKIIATGRAGALLGLAAHLVEQLAMAAMDAVEVAEPDDRIGPLRPRRHPGK